MGATILLVASLLALDGSSEATRDDPLQLARAQAMVARAHEYLVDQQNPDGSFSVTRNHSGRSAPVAVTSLAALSLMAAGHLPDRGRYELAVTRAVDWLVDRCVLEGDEAGYFRHDSDQVSKMHGQGYALLALTQAAGMYAETADQRRRLSDAIQRAVDLVERTQGAQGGWYYDPQRMAAHENSITVCMIQALRAAKDAGFAVDGHVIDRALAYVRASQDPETGRFRYALGDDRMTWALTAAALSTLNAAGDYSSDELRNGFDALRRGDPYMGHGSSEGFRQYGTFYAAQSYWTSSDRRLFEEWWSAYLDRIADDQRDSGAFPNGTYGAVYATAMVSLTLQVPMGILPIFQR